MFPHSEQVMLRSVMIGTPVPQLHAVKENCQPPQELMGCNLQETQNNSLSFNIFVSAHFFFFISQWYLSHKSRYNTRPFSFFISDQNPIDLNVEGPCTPLPCQNLLIPPGYLHLTWTPVSTHSTYQPTLTCTQGLQTQLCLHFIRKMHVRKKLSKQSADIKK